MVNAGDVEGIFRLFNAALTEGISANAKAFNDENSIRDFIYVLLPRNGIIKTRENPNARGFSDLAYISHLNLDNFVLFIIRQFKNQVPYVS